MANKILSRGLEGALAKRRHDGVQEYRIGGERTYLSMTNAINISERQTGVQEESENDNTVSAWASQE
jgi:hypothetical protein